ncbi:Peptidyl-prolyl cis-trans isomerase CYP59 [Linum perenne]
MTCKNFLKLCKIRYYDGCLFHSVQKDFVAQTGDPTATGSGGDSFYRLLNHKHHSRFFYDEIRPDLNHGKLGTVAMAGLEDKKNTNASQFYITLRDRIDYLDGKHTVFGEVAEGLDTLQRINEAYVDGNGKPYKNIRIKRTYILDDPFSDPPGISDLIATFVPDSKSDSHDRLEDDWIPLDEKGLSTAEIEETVRSKAARSSAVVLEAIGDIPSAESKPAENVLFVCKLNPVTDDESLEIIFSRYGNVKSANLIRDRKTGESLCYGFIEFESKDGCERAKIGSDNRPIQIDGKLIRVDFSQSVAKQWPRRKRLVSSCVDRSERREAVGKRRRIADRRSPVAGIPCN